MLKREKRKEEMKETTYRIIRCPTSRGIKYIGIAWNYSEAVFISTHARDSYAGARTELQSICDSRNVKLRWFDGEYIVEKDVLIPVP